MKKQMTPRLAHYVRHPLPEGESWFSDEQNSELGEMWNLEVAALSERRYRKHPGYDY